MPVEIRELVIRFSVEDRQKELRSTEISSQASPKLVKAIINECVETVLHKIEKRLER
jgi:Family of unknown function (DUF5908)